MSNQAREMLHNFALTYRVESKESRKQCLDQALKEFEAIHQQEIVKARIDELLHLDDESIGTDWKANAWFSVSDRIAELKKELDDE